VRVARYDYASQFSPVLEEVTSALRRALIEGAYGVEGDVAAFEREFADYVGVGHGRGVNTGTDALVLALMALGIGPGSEVLAPANTFHATVAAIVRCGATPVLVDADPETFLMDLGLAEAAVTSKTKAMVPVHLYGKVTPLTAAKKLATAHGLALVEDAAQAHGGRDADRTRAGSAGDAGCFSFHPSKNLAAAGDAGMVVTNDPDLAERLRCLRALGQPEQNHHVAVGLNSKLHALQAIVLRAKLPRLDEWNADRRRIARAYRKALADCPLRFQAEDPGELHAYHLLPVRTTRRDALLDWLRKAGVDAVIRFPVPIHLQPAFADQGWRPGDFPVAEALSRELLCLPLYPGMPTGEVEYVVTKVRGFFGR
jgi:dTDP-4-amino-4,6-dideoxygalactose transaminase